MPITNYAANRIIDGIIGRSNNVTLASNSYVGLLLAEPTADGEYSEVGAGTNPACPSYQRARIGLYNQTATYLMRAAVDGATANTEIIYFPEALESWGDCTYFGIFDSANKGQGHLIAYGRLTDSEGEPTTIKPVVNSVPLLRVGDLTISLS